MKRGDLEHWQKLMAAWDASRDRRDAAGDEPARRSAELKMQEQQRQIAEFIKARAKKRTRPGPDVRLGLLYPQG